MTMNFIEGKDMTNNAIKIAAKNKMMDAIMGSLCTAFGDDNVSMVRTGTEKSKTNEIGVRIGTVDYEGTPCELCVTINPTIKEYRDRSTSCKTYTAFNFDAAVKEYIDNIAEKEAKAKERTKKED